MIDHGLEIADYTRSLRRTMSDQTIGGDQLNIDLSRVVVSGYRSTIATSGVVEDALEDMARRVAGRCER